MVHKKRRGSIHFFVTLVTLVTLCNARRIIAPPPRIYRTASAELSQRLRGPVATAPQKATTRHPPQRQHPASKRTTPRYGYMAYPLSPMTKDFFRLITRTPCNILHDFATRRNAGDGSITFALSIDDKGASPAPSEEGDPETAD